MLPKGVGCSPLWWRTSEGYTNPNSSPKQIHLLFKDIPLVDIPLVDRTILAVKDNVLTHGKYKYRLNYEIQTRINSSSNMCNLEASLLGYIFNLVTIRFATYGGEPKEAHRIPLGLLWQTQTHSLTCSLPKVANTSGGEGSEPYLLSKLFASPPMVAKGSESHVPQY